MVINDRLSWCYYGIGFTQLQWNIKPWFLLVLYINSSPIQQDHLIDRKFCIKPSWRMVCSLQFLFLHNSRNLLLCSFVILSFTHLAPFYVASVFIIKDEKWTVSSFKDPTKHFKKMFLTCLRSFFFCIK